jgi:hypothetical protein
MTTGIKWSIDSVYPPRESDNTDPNKKRVLGRVSFAFVPPELKPITISQRWTDKSSGQKRSKVVVEIEPGNRVRVIDGRIYADKNGEPFVITDIDLDFDLARELATAAMKELGERKAGAA